MVIPVDAVHRAALAIREQGDISQCDFEDEYHCRFGVSPEPGTYWLHFDSPRYATAFILRWL